MKMNTEYVEDVSGAVVGAYLLTGAVFYAGRKQGGDLLASTEHELKDLANEYIRLKKAECGDALIYIFPLDSWELRIYEA